MRRSPARHLNQLDGHELRIIAQRCAGESRTIMAVSEHEVERSISALGKGPYHAP